MISRRHSLYGGTVALALVGLILSTPGFAEVAAGTDDKGRYRTTRVTGTRLPVEPRLWTQAGHGSGFAVLNPDGDANGDLWPVLVESSRVPHYPWVAWSRNTGLDYDVAWSRWDGKHWTPIRWVVPGKNVFDDLDPDLAFDHRGRPFITWWRDENGVGRVFISVNLNDKWITPSQVSISKLDSRFPTILVQPSGRLIVEFLTPRGVMQQGLVFWERTSITDDINPHFEFSGEAEIVGQPIDNDDDDTAKD
jgi:hypothetical protein